MEETAATSGPQGPFETSVTGVTSGPSGLVETAGHLATPRPFSISQEISSTFAWLQEGNISTGKVKVTPPLSSHIIPKA